MSRFVCIRMRLVRHHSPRAFDDMKRHLPIIIATVLCLPFCAFIAVYLVALALGPAHIPDLIGIPLLSGLYWLSQSPGVVLLVLLLVSASVVSAWRQSVKTRF